MTYNALPRIRSRPVTAGTWDLTGRQRLADDLRVRFADSGFSRPRNDRDVPLYTGRVSDSATVAQLRDELRHCQEQIAKKNKLLAQLASVDASKFDSGLTNDQLDQLLSTTKIEQTALLEKLESLQSQLREAECQLERRDDKIRELTRLIEISRDNEAQHSAESRDLRRQISDYQLRINAGSVTGSTGLADVPALHDRIRDLEARIRAHTDDREKSEQDRMSVERKLSELFRLLMLDSQYRDIGNVDRALDHVVNKTREVMQDNATLTGRLSTVQSQLDVAETEHRTQRETILRLMNDQQNVAQFNVEMDNLRVERDNATARQRELESEVESVKDRLEASQRAWSAMRRELDEQKSVRAAEVDRDRLAAAAEGQTKAFKECLARMLSDGCIVVEPFEEMIRERVQVLIIALQDKSAQIETFESKLSKMASQLDAQYELNKVADRKTKRAEADLLDMEQKLRQLECATHSSSDSDVLLEQQKYVRFVERLSRALNMASFHPDVSIDSATSAIIARAEQLCQAETTAERDNSLVCGLRHKVKRLKEKLNDKEVEVTSIQRKLLSVEDQLAARPDVDDVFAKNRKLMSLIDKYKSELNEAHREIRELKSRLLDTADAKLKVEMKERDIVGLEAKLDQLATVKDRQAGQIEGLRQSRQQLDEKSGQASNTIRHLTDELNKVKYTLDDVTRRQRQLVKLRQTVGRMLGLNVGPATSADFEIVSRLEKLIVANKNNMDSTIPIDASFDQLAHAFRQGHGNVTFDLDKSRSRSVSPARKRDTKVY